MKTSRLKYLLILSGILVAAWLLRYILTKNQDTSSLLVYKTPIINPAQANQATTPRDPSVALSPSYTPSAPAPTKTRAVSAEIPTQKPNLVQSDGKKPTEEIHEQWEILSTQTRDSIPSIRDLQKLTSAETHHTPALLIKAGEKLGEMAELLEAHPELKSQAIPFYEECARKEESPKSIRAVCYFNLQKYTSADKYADDKSISQEVKELAKHLE